MKKYKYILCFIISILLAGCNQSKVNQPSNSDTPIVQNETAPAISVPKEEDNLVISDIANWEHPTKKVFADNGIAIKKIILKKEKTYPEFYVELPNNDKVKDISLFEGILRNIAKENGFWDYKLIDESLSVEIEVFCDKPSTSVSNIQYKNKDKYFKTINSGLERIKINLSDVDMIIKNTLEPLPKNYVVDCESIEDMEGKLYYVLHEYESVVDNKQTGAGHTATLGWYFLDAVDGTVYKWNLAEKAVEVTKNKSPRVLNVNMKENLLGWKTLYNSTRGYDTCLWQVNSTLGILQKIDLTTLKLVKEIDIKKTFVHGKIVALSEVSGAYDIPSQLYIAVKDEDKYSIYKSIADDTFKWFRNKDDSGNAFGKIDNFSFYIDKNEKIPRIKGQINYDKVKLDSINDTNLTWVDLSKSK